MTRFFAVVLAFLASIAASAAHPWVAPTGIPVPEFGIAESHLMYSGDDNYRDAGNGPYSIYVDNSASNCRNSGPGTAEQPRCEIPSRLPTPGMVVEIHGGPYKFENVKQVIEANGSKERPIFIRGIDDGKGFPVIDDANTFGFQGQYLIVENLIFEKSSVRTGAPGTPPNSSHHVALRNLEIMRHPTKNGSGLGGEHIVFYKNHVHHNFGDDRHGTTVGRGSNQVWIVDNYYHHNGGDAIQFCHHCRKDPPRNVYVGRNLMHSDRENAVDLKFGKYIVVSENTMYGYKIARPDTEWCFDDNSYCGKFSSGSDGSAIVVGSDGAPKNPWILYNHIYDSAQAIRIEEVKSAWLIGNVIHDISMRAFPLQKDGDPLYLIGNFIFDVEKGIDQYWRDNFALQVHGNVFANIKEQFLNVDGGVAGRSAIENNMFWNDSGRITLHWGRGQGFAPTPGNLALRNGSGNFIGDPKIDLSPAGVVNWDVNEILVKHVRDKIREYDAEFKSQFSQDVTIIRGH